MLLSDYPFKCLIWCTVILISIFIQLGKVIVIEETEMRECELSSPIENW